MPELKHTQPCNKCPWRRNSAAGWLGAASPEDFLMATHSEVEMPCHAAINYEDKDWEENQYPTAPLCAGALIHLKNHMKQPRDPKLNEAVNSVECSDDVFQWGPEFLAHHKRLDNGA